MCAEWRQDYPQVFQVLTGVVVDMLLIIYVAALQQALISRCRVCVAGFLPTMKSQLSQLPLIVGSGRVNT